MDDIQFSLGAIGSDDEPSESSIPAGASYSLGVIPYGVYDNLESVKTHLQEVAEREGYKLVLGKNTYNKENKVHKYWFRCKRHGTITNGRKLTEETRRRRQRPTVKTGCPMRIIIASVDPNEPDGQWEARPSIELHNHPRDDPNILPGRRQTDRDGDPNIQPKLLQYRSVFPSRPLPPTAGQVKENLTKCLQVQRAGAQQGKRPFAAILVAPDNVTVLLSHFSISHVEHAESCLARLAAIQYAQPYLWQCTMYSTWEPCAMCAGTLYWSNIGRLIYAASEDTLRQITGEGNEENFTMTLDCRIVLQSGQKAIEVWGPVPEMEEEVVKDADRYWMPIREGARKGAAK